MTLFHQYQAGIEYKNVNWFENGVDGVRKDYYAFQLDDTVVDNESEVINTKPNPKTNDEVQMVLYWRGNQLKVIPNTLFTTFPNLEYFYISNQQQFKHLQPQFFKNGKNLKVIRIYSNLIAELAANVLAETPNLEHLNLQHNKIEKIHVLAFNSLSKLKGVYLEGNQIKVLHSRTFSYLPQLERLDLAKNVCINKTFAIENQNYVELEKDIDDSCSYDLKLEDVVNLKGKDLIVDLKLNEVSTDLRKLEKTMEKRLQDNKNQFEALENSNSLVVRKLTADIQEENKNHLESMTKSIRENDGWGQEKFENLTRAIQNASNLQMHHLNSSIAHLHQEIHLIASNLESTKSMVNNIIDLHTKNMYRMIKENEKTIKELKEHLNAPFEESSRLRIESSTLR